MRNQLLSHLPNQRPPTLKPLSLATLVVALMLSFSAVAAPSAKLWDVWDGQDANSSLEVDHRPWQAWLDEYLVTLPNGATAVRYTSVDAAGRLALDGYIQSLSAMDPLQLNRDQQFAYWVNLYNAVTVQVVLNHPEEDSITDMGSGWFSGGPWDEDLVRINGKPVTLNDIEHRILRPIWQDHRIHYVVNCASIGCPNLSPQALTADNAEAQLAAAEQHFVNHPKGVMINDQGKLVLSKIYQWYREDFPEDDDSFIQYLEGLLSPDASTGVTGDALRAKFSNLRYAYDWNLNGAP